MNSGLPSLLRPKRILIRSLKEQGILKSPQVENALLSINREDFAWPKTSVADMYVDEPLPLGDTGQTISAPHMITIMLEALELKANLIVLEIGTGSGYNAALMGYIVSKQASEDSLLIVSVERNEQLAEFARANIKKIGLQKIVKVVNGDGSLGYPPRSKEPTFDRILVAAGARSVPVYLEEQLKIGGILQIPIGNLGFQNLVKIRKIPNLSRGEKNYTLEKRELTSCVFVPLIGNGVSN